MSLADRLSDLGVRVDASAKGSPRPAEDGADEAESLWRSGAVAGVELADALARLYALERGAFADVAAAPAKMEGLSRRFLREAWAFPFERAGRATLALADPSPRPALDAVALALGEKPDMIVLAFEDVDLLFERANPESEGADAAGPRDRSAEDSPEAIDDLKDLALGAPIVRLLDGLLERAIETGATDIHIETARDELRVRFRVDGQLRIEQTVPKALAAAVISRVKILAGLDIAERRLPQDGRANVAIGRAEADLRVATMPTIYGETAVLRILLKDLRLLDFERIGLTGEDRRAFEALLAEPHGIVIVTGPTGSGKTTTLAAAMRFINDPARKIVTVEDPIEYQIPGVHQTQIKPSIGLTFANALRSFLRHDPDVIMVGEMRDPETAAVGAQAALTGHLVLTTLHTNSAADAVVRLADMGVESYLISSVLRGVIGQRLVRRLCERCKRPDPRAAEAARTLAASRGVKLADASGACSAPGCAACGHTGFRGRLGIFETMRMDDELRGLVRRAPDPSALLAAARRAGMTTMLEDGLRKVCAGTTSVAEVLRATG